MKPAPFKYSVPESLKAGLGFKAQHGDDARLLSGGHNLIPAMNFRLMQPALLLDLNPPTAAVRYRAAYIPLTNPEPRCHRRQLRRFRPGIGVIS